LLGAEGYQNGTCLDCLFLSKEWHIKYYPSHL
jgi:hypothetical protein